MGDGLRAENGEEVEVETETETARWMGRNSREADDASGVVWAVWQFSHSWTQTRKV